MATISLDDTPFRGVSRSFTRMQSARTTISCVRCSSSLANRRETTRWSTIGAVRFEVDIYRCRCGKRREIRRSA
jgi:hypothetical protein